MEDSRPQAVSPSRHFPAGISNPVPPQVTVTAYDAYCPHVFRRKDPKTVTETVFVTISVDAVSFATETETVIRTDTVFVNRTIYQPITQTVHYTQSATLTQTVPTTVQVTPTSAAKATLSPVPVPVHQEAKLGDPAVAGITIGATAGLVLLMAIGWLAMRKYRGWKAKKNQHMRGVELQRNWEREQEAEREMRAMGGDTLTNRV